MRVLSFACVLGLVALPAVGAVIPRDLRTLIQPIAADSVLITGESGADCAGGIAYDTSVPVADSVGFGYIGPEPSPPTHTIAMRFDLPGEANRIDAVCIRPAQRIIFLGTVPLSNIPFDLDVWAADGPGGSPGTLLGSRHGLVATDVPYGFCDDNLPFFRFDIPGGITVPTSHVFIGITWALGQLHDNGTVNTQLCGFVDGPLQPGYNGTTRPPTQQLGTVGNAFAYKSLSIRAEVTEVDVTPPAPPATGVITSDQYPGYQFWVRISDSRIGTKVTDCLPETVCIAGAIPTRAEVFVRIVGPKGNGYLWTNVVKFNSTKTEVWVRRGSKTNYYLLPALPAESDELPGLVDKTSFLP